MTTLKCETCGGGVEVSPDFNEMLTQLSYYLHLQGIECIKCAGMRAKIDKRNRVLSTHTTPVKDG